MTFLTEHFPLIRPRDKDYCYCYCYCYDTATKGRTLPTSIDNARMFSWEEAPSILESIPNLKPHFFLVEGGSAEQCLRGADGSLGPALLQGHAKAVQRR